MNCFASVPFCQSEFFRYPAIIDVAGVCFHIAQYGYGILGTCIHGGDVFILIQMFRQFPFFRERLFQQFFIQFIYDIHGA